MDKDHLEHRLRLENWPDHVLLLRYFNSIGSKETARSVFSTKDYEATNDTLTSPTDTSITPISTGEEQSSPGEFTPGSESSDAWQEVEDQTDLFDKCDTIVHGLSNVFDELFQTWLGEIRCNNGGQRAPSASGPARNAKSEGTRPEPKRKRLDNADGQDEDASPEGSRSTGKKRRKTMPLETQLACPYFKKDPRRHRACCGYGGQKLSYVKQHLNRNHTISLYCPVCLAYFPDERVRDEHIIARTCERLGNQQAPEGITMEQRIWLSRRGPSHMSEEQHWKRIFQYLFPGQPLPNSVYNDTTFSEEFLDFRDFISEPTGLDLLLTRVRGNPHWTAEHEALFGPDIRQGLGQLYWLWAAARQGESNRVVATETPGHESQDTLSTTPDEAVHQPDLQPAEDLVTRGRSFDSSMSMSREQGPPVFQNEMRRVGNGRQQAVYDAVQSDTDAFNTINEQECPKLDNNEDLDGFWQSSSIALTRIPQGQPRTSLTRLDQPDTEPLDLPVLGDDAQVGNTLPDFQPEHLSVGFGGSENWAFSSLLRQDDAGYLPEHFGLAHENVIQNNVAEALTGTMGMTHEEETAIIAELGNCIFVPQQPE